MTNGDRIYCCKCTDVTRADIDRDTIDGYEVGGGTFVIECHKCGAKFFFRHFGSEDPHASQIHQYDELWAKATSERAIG